MDTTTRSPLSPQVADDRPGGALVEAAGPAAPTAGPAAAATPIPRDELMRAFGASWDRNEAAYRYLGR